MKKSLLMLCVAIIVAVAGFAGYKYFTQNSSSASNNSESVSTASVGDLELDDSKNYGNKYADGILPVGDEQYSTSGAEKGKIYLCRTPRGGGGGAESRGPWFTNNNTEYDLNKKVSVSGDVKWDGNYSVSKTSDTRTITTNDLPVSHNTGTFPVQSNDAAYSYDKNPNAITAQSLTYSLSANPVWSKTANCMGGEVGVMTTGVAIFNGFDAGGRDAGAWEVQDGCSGHPQIQGEYHYHTLSKCITDVSVNNVIGYALDGFPITGPKVGDNNFLTTGDLDACHGLTSTITLDGKRVKTYHYVMTQDFPYSVSCFRSSAINPPR